MKKYLETIKKSPLFKGIEESEIEAMLGCLSVKARKYARHEFVMRFGDSTEAIGMVLSGSVHIVKEDFWGNRNIVTEIGPGQIFAESYACTPGAALGVSVVAAEAAAVMFMNVRRVLTPVNSTRGCLETCSPSSPKRTCASTTNSRTWRSAPPARSCSPISPPSLCASEALSSI